MANIVVALAGNANVGKSVIFNELTGLHQHVGNWPGKTVERAEGTLNFEGQEIDVIDLPGIYSLSTYSIEELISREYIAVEHPDVIVNVLDASSLERNLAFTLQLLELEPHIVIALNQIDVAENKGIIVYPNKLSEELGVPVVPTVVIKGAGLAELMRVALEEASKDIRAKSFRYGPEVEDQITELVNAISVDSPYPSRWICIKLLEGDEEVERMVFEAQPNIRERVLEARVRLEEVHGHDAASIIASERYALANRIATECSNIVVPEQTRVDQVLGLTTHRFWGYVFMIASILIIFFVIFSFGDWLAGLFDLLFGWIQAHYFSFFGKSALSALFFAL